MSQILIRAFRSQSDLPLLLSWEREVFSSWPSADGLSAEQNESRVAEYVRTLEQEDAGDILIAESAGRPVGALVMTTFAYFGRRIGLLEFAFVEPDFRRQGVATALFERAAQRARDRGLSGLQGFVHVGNEAIQRLLGRFGFARTRSVFDLPLDGGT